MGDDAFDVLTRTLGGATSRRQTLKLLGSTLTVSLLAALGVGCSGPPPQPSICTAASSPNERHYCSDDDSCLCIRSAEGPIRCGQIPSCDAQRCTVSSDCAGLGEGYFCDTPNSGRCNDAELQRCIAPCAAPSAQQAQLAGLGAY